MWERLMGTRFAIVAVLAVAAGAVVQARQDAERRPTLAIVEFETAPGGSMLPPRELGSTLSQLMLDHLVTSGRYQVLDAQWLAHGRRDRDTLLETIRARAVESPIDYVVLGSVIRFSNENRRRGGTLLPLAAVVATRGLALPLLAAFQHDRSELVMAVTVRVIDVRTGMVVATAIGQGTASRKKVGFGGLGAGPRAVAGGGYVSAASEFRDALIAEAATNAVTMAAQQLVAAAPRLAAPRQETPRRP